MHDEEAVVEEKIIIIERGREGTSVRRATWRWRAIYLNRAGGVVINQGEYYEIE
jgi:hypothetical protein